MGKNIDEFISNSQKYQSEVIETAINFYRRKKFKGITGIFQFMFIDCWPSITWSVVDFYEKPKLAYETLKRVYQPVFISTNVRQNQYYPGKKLLLDFHIINDFHKKFSNCKLNLLLDGKKFQSLKNINLKEDDLVFINYESFEFFLPLKISFGKHKIDLELIDNKNKVFSKNFFNINIVKNITNY
jgi:beta-mannosidase